MEPDDEREFEEGAAGTRKDRKNDPLTEYSDKEAMTPAKIKEHEPTAVNRDPNDQRIVGGGKTGTDSPEALEEYRRQGMTKVGDEDKISEAASTVKEGSESTFDKLKAGAKALGKKVTDIDGSLETAGGGNGRHGSPSS